MLTKLTIRNFKLFEDIELELGDRVVLIGPNNAGKSSALQALALWDAGVKRWSEKRGAGNVPAQRPGVTINRRDLITVPVATAKLLWRNLHTQEWPPGGKNQPVFIDVIVEGVTGAKVWSCGLEFYYANEESFYCRSLRLPDGGRMDVPAEATGLQLAYLPPMSGLLANETRLDEGAINVRLGEGRTAEVLRNLCYQVLQGPEGKDRWQRIVERMESLFGIQLDPPEYVRERGEIQMSYRTRNEITLDISSSGRGQQQTLLLLAHLAVHPASVLLLDEPDAHLEFLRQRQIYQLLTDAASETGSQIIAASHSEVLLSEAAQRDIVIAFVGRPHKLADRGSQVLKSLREIGFDQYIQAEETRWVLYLEGATDLAMLLALARKLNHPARGRLERPFVKYVFNQPPKALEHFHALREATPSLSGIALYDRLDQAPNDDPYLKQAMWRRRELESYLCNRETLLTYAEELGTAANGSLFGAQWRNVMESAITTIEESLQNLGKPSPWGPDLKASDEFLTPVFKKFYADLQLPNPMSKTDFHTLVEFLPVAAIDQEITEKLNLIESIAAGVQAN